VSSKEDCCQLPSHKPVTASKQHKHIPCQCNGELRSRRRWSRLLESWLCAKLQAGPRERPPKKEQFTTSSRHAARTKQSTEQSTDQILLSTPGIVYRIAVIHESKDLCSDTVIGQHITNNSSGQSAATTTTEQLASPADNTPNTRPPRLQSPKPRFRHLQQAQQQQRPDRGHESL
jgi:hypothetical protein